MIAPKDLPLLRKEIFALATYIREVLNKHGIKPFAMYGSCLGALRHCGWIPWDDDFDFALLREEYTRAIEILSSECPDLLVWEWNHVESCQVPFAKLFWRKPHTHLEYCACVDLFPLDNAPRTMFEGKIRRVLLTAVRRCINRKTVSREKIAKYSHGKDFLFKLITLPVCWLPPRILRRVYLNLLHVVSDAPYLWVPTGGEYHYLKKDYFSTTRTVPFEDGVVEVPIKTEEYLVDNFGDWQSPPPESERVGHSWGEDGRCLVYWPEDFLRDLSRMK